MSEQCEPVIWPAVPAEIAAVIGDDLSQARVRPLTENPEALPDTAEARATAGLDLSGYNWRGPEAGVARGGVWGRWWISVSGSSVRPDRIVRPEPLRLDVGRPLGIRPELSSSVLEAVVWVSGSTAAGRELIDEYAAGPDLIAEIAAARSTNPHRSPVGNGRVTVGGALVTVGCTIPKIPVSVSGLDRVYFSQATPLFRAGIERMDWIFRPTGEFLKADLYRQIGWTLTPTALPVSGTWELTAWSYNAPGYTASYSQISESINISRQPGVSSGTEDPLAQNRKRTQQFLTDVAESLNRVNADSNIIRGLQIVGGNERIRQRRRIEVVFPIETVAPTGGGGGGGVLLGRDVNTPNTN